MEIFEVFMLEKEERPWGWYEVLVETDDYKVKRICVNPGQRLSLQKHFKRSEHWYVVEGELTVEKGLDEVSVFTFTKKDHINIPQGFWHRASNFTDDSVIFIEIQTGSYFGEDDIIRKEDDYDRI